MDEGLVTIARLNDIQKASFIQAMLEEQGIESFLQGQTLATLGYPGTVQSGKLQLQVRSSQAEQATQYLIEHHFVTPGSHNWFMKKIHNYLSQRELVAEKINKAYTFLKYLFIAGFILGIIIVLFKWLMRTE